MISYSQKIARLCIALYCHGARLHTSAEKLQEHLFQRRAGLGSGLEICISSPAKTFWVNLPILEKFCQNSPYSLCRDNIGYYITMCEKEITRIHVPNLPAWYNHKTSHGLLMSQIGVLQGTYLGIYVGDCCHFWSESPSQACKFCATGLNVGHYEAATKTIEDVVETALAAKSESGITFVHLNSGYQGGNDLMQMLPYVQALKKHVGILIGLQTIPSANLSEYDRLISAGVDHFSFCYELHSTSSFNEYLPGKAKHIGQKRFWDALEYVAKKMPRGSVSGEIIAGIEPLESTIEAIHYIATHGAFPTVCIFRPLMKTPLENMESPAEEDMCRVLEHVAHACMNNNIPIGLAPNLEVSIVMTPDDCQYLLPQNFRWRIHYYKNHLLKIMAKPIFAWKMRKHG